MADCKKKYCRLCQGEIPRKKTEVLREIIREVAAVVLPNLNSNQTDLHVICDDCSVKLFAAFDFKAMCLNTEDSIFPFVNSEVVLPIDLETINLKQFVHGKSTGKLGRNVCRMCMELINAEFMALEVLDQKMICKYLPEVNFGNTKDPVVCKTCADSLVTHFNFLKNFFNAHEAVENIPDSRDTAIHQISEASLHIKEEKIESDGYVVDTPMREIPDLKDSQMKIYASNDHKLGSESKGNFRSGQSKHKNVSKIKRKQSDSQTVGKNCIKRRRKTALEEKMYKCDNCPYKTIYKQRFGAHQLQHEGLLAGQMFECDRCDFKTNMRIIFRRHQGKHPQIYKCHNCHFQSHLKHSLVKHNLRHRSPSEMDMYKCDICQYETCYKSSLKSHMLRHKNPSEVQMHKCNECDYATRYKSHLTMHLMVHKEPSEVRMYRCDNCAYQTRIKYNIIEHHLRHKDPSEVQMHKCNVCFYETKYRRTLLSHHLKHKVFSEVEMHKCGECDFQTKWRASFVRHRNNHEGVSKPKPKTYKCRRCSYETKSKKRLVAHQLEHEEDSKVD